MLLKYISYLELWQPFCSVERNQLCNFGKGYNEEQFCEIILNLGQFLFDLILYVPSTIFQLYRDESSWVETLTSTKLG